MDWFKDWFNTPYYHLLYRHRNDAEAKKLILALLAYLQLPPQADILDLACGKGRHARFMAQQGYRVRGIDLSEASIAEAQQWANDRLHFYVHDMREVFRTDAFDLICNLFTSFGYFEQHTDNLRTLQAIHTALKKKGVLVIDFLNAPRSIAHLRPHEIQTIEGIQFDITRYVENGFIVKNIAINDDGKHYQFAERVQALTLDDFAHYFHQTGFDMTQVWGNYDLQPYHAETSDRLIMVACKR